MKSVHVKPIGALLKRSSIIYSAAKNLNPSGPSEGYDEVYLVRMELKDKFHVERLFKE